MPKWSSVALNGSLPLPSQMAEEKRNLLSNIETLQSEVDHTREQLAATKGNNRVCSEDFDHVTVTW